MENKISLAPKWLEATGRDSDVIISTRVRLARNIKGRIFPNKLSDEDKREVLKMIDKMVQNGGLNSLGVDYKVLDLEKSSLLDRCYLLEQHLISPKMVKENVGAGALIDRDGNTSVLINEEDHFRIQAFSSGLDLKGAYELADGLDDCLENIFSYAFHSNYGYLTACPTNIGTGIRFSVMIHLPALAMTKKLSEIAKSINKSGFAIRGFFGEGSEGVGDMFQISNQKTIGKNEMEMLDSLEKIIEKIVLKERESREFLFKNRSYEMLDLIYRAYGVVKYSKLLSAKEGMNILSRLRLGLASGYFNESKITLRGINELLVLNQVYSLQAYCKKEMSIGERDQMRPRIFRDVLGLKEDYNDLG